MEDEKSNLLQSLKDLKKEFQECTSSPRRYLTNDPTVEKLAEILKSSPNGILLMRDELSGFFANLDKQGREGDRSFYLESWSGDGSHSSDRIGRGSIYVAGLCISVFGGIQPSKLKKYVLETSEHSFNNDGLLQRFQILFSPDRRREWRSVDRLPNATAQAQVERIFQHLADIDVLELGAESCGENSIPFLHFDDEAQNIYDQWIADLERRLRSGQIQSEALESHIGKYRSLMPSLALTWHLAEYAFFDGFIFGKVPARCARRAILLVECLEVHARKTYALAESSKIEAANELLSKIRSGQVRDGDTVRTIYRNHWSLLDSKSQVEKAIAALHEANIAQIQEVSTGGAPSEVIRIHPDIINEVSLVRSNSASNADPLSRSNNRGSYESIH